jgi:hypothetical protein
VEIKGMEERNIEEEKIKNNGKGMIEEFEEGIMKEKAKKETEKGI